MSSPTRFAYPRPPVRPLKIYASDPMVGLDVRTRISIDTRNEPLLPGPAGARIVVIDYDATHDCFYKPVDLDDPAILMQGGIDHSESDPRFHQQMVYAVASRIVSVFDRALGRSVELSSEMKGGKPRPIRLYPHAFNGANAFYTEQAGGAILFGYFRAVADDPGANIPGQVVFSCLSHDVIAHELTHALIDRLSPALKSSEHPDPLALHEGLSDLVPILDRFSLTSVVADELRRTGGKLTTASPLCFVAPQFGAAIGLTHALRTADMAADPRQYQEQTEPHARGSILMSLTMEAVFQAYDARVRDLYEIAGLKGPGDAVGPDLIARLATEASRTALNVLTMYIRAFDYLPPIDVSFGDFLRAVVTADWELAPDDPGGQRAALIEAFRRRGIYATGASSLAERSLIWNRPEHQPEPLPASIVAALTRTAQSFRRIRPGEGEGSQEEAGVGSAESLLVGWARRNARALHLGRGRTLKSEKPRYSFRVTRDGQLAVDIIARFIQHSASGRPRGVTVIAGADGNIRYVIPNQPLPKIERAPAEAEAVTTTALAPPPDEPRVVSKPPFPARYRLSAAKYYKAYPHLKPPAAELKQLRDVTGEPHLP
jgi:hypothetical protein